MKYFTRLFLFSLFILFQINSSAQNATHISGNVLDSLESPLTGASIMLMHQQDSLLEGFAIADGNGNFKVTAKSADEYILQITFIGYGTFARHITITENEPHIDLGNIILNPDAVVLEGATVTAEFIPILFKGDTVEYNANAFKTKEGAVVEDLLKKLPGVEVDKNGKITAHGEEVKNILIDGKQFFEDDPKMASKNIPADIVDRVQVFDKASDFASFTGIDDGNDEKTINLAIKDGKNKGTFGNIKAGYGTDERYTAGLNLNRFNSKMQLSGIGNLNNINEQAFSMNDYFDFMGGISEVMRGGQIDMSSLPINLLNNSGITKAFSGGLNFNYDFNKQTSLRSNYFTSHSDNFTLGSTDFINVLENGNFSNKNNSSENSTLTNHRIRLNFHHKFSATEDFKINLKGAINNSDLFNSSNSTSLLNNSISINNALAQSTNNAADFSWQADGIYRKKLKKQGRFFTSEIGVGKRNGTNDYTIENQTEFLNTEPPFQIDSLNQLQEESLDNISYKIKLDYVEPLVKFQYLNFSLKRNNDLTDREKIFSNKDKSGNYFKDDELSNSFERGFTQNTLGIGYRYIREKIRFSFGTDFQLIDLKNNDFSIEPLEKTFKNILPNASLNFSIDKHTRLMSRYTTQIEVPSVEELQPVLQNNDPLNIYIGNPNLEAAYKHSLDFRLSYFNMFYFRSFFIGGNIGYKNNAIVNQISIDENLVRTTKPINNGNEISTSGYFDFKTPIPGIDLKVRTNGNANYTKSNLLINDFLDKVHNLNWTQTFELENKDKEYFDLLAGYRLGLNKTTFDTNTDQDQSYLNHDLFSNLIVYLGETWTVEIDYERQLFAANDFFPKTHFNFLDASIAKSFLNNQLSISLNAINLFDEQIRINRNSFGNQYYEKTSNRLGRIFMMKAVWKIRSFGK